MTDELSPAQELVLGPTVRLVEASPGAGKTRSIVARFRAESIKRNGGVGLLSFTNAAINEAVRRTASDSRLTDSPNFVGTFDSFIHRFIVTPWFRRTERKSPTYVDSWDELPEEWTRLRHARIPGAGLALSSFSPNSDGDLEYATEPPSDEQAYVAQLRSARPQLSPQDLLSRAGAIVSGLLGAGTFDCDQARIKALNLLEDSEMGWLHTRLSVRFREIIVDEFQDCSAIEHRLIGDLESIGIRVVVVADPDQSIYEFRRATPNAFADYKRALAPEEIVNLTENYRSTVAICELTSSLRSIGSDPITSAANFGSDPHAQDVLVLVGSPGWQRQQFTNRAESLQIALSDLMVLSPTRAGASRLAGEPKTDESGHGNTGRLIHALATLRSSRSAVNRQEALKRATRLILGSFQWSAPQTSASSKSRLDAVGLSEQNMSQVMRDLLAASSSWAALDDVKPSIVDALQNRLGSLSVPLVALTTRFQKVKQEDWDFWDSSVSHSDALRGVHIHAVKGLEFEGVLLDIPDRKRPNHPYVMDDWETSNTSEALRILYVGASRARRLIALAITPRRQAQLRRILTADHVHAEFVVEP